MFHRILSKKLVYLFTKFPVIAVQGPRQSGKTTLVRQVFSQLPYVNMEDLEMQSFAKEDPKRFLAAYPDGLIIDEVQNVPDILSYIQVRSDEKNTPGQYVLTGSQHFMLQERISQSLAGRIAITTLLPFSYEEVKDESHTNIYDLLYQGMYPRTHQYDINPGDFFPSYIQTYIEKDVRQIKNVSDLSMFQKFLKLCAGRTGQMLNLSSLGNDCGISYVTAKQWISLLEMSFIVRLLQPHHNNFNKRLVKTPKLYFYDTGVLCNLLNITSAAQLEVHYMKGPIFENFVICELLKQSYNHGLQPQIYFWRNKTGHEIDVILERGSDLIPIEIKAGQTINGDYFKNLHYWQQLADSKLKGYVVYTGNLEQDRGSIQVINWAHLSGVS